MEKHFVDMENGGLAMSCHLSKATELWAQDACLYFSDSRNDKIISLTTKL